MTGFLERRGYFDENECIGKNDVKTQRADDHLQAKERDLEQIFASWPSEETNLASTFILNFEPAELWERKKNSVILSFIVCGIFYGNPRKLIYPLKTDFPDLVLVLLNY